MARHIANLTDTERIANALVFGESYWGIPDSRYYKKSIFKLPLSKKLDTQSESVLYDNLNFVKSETYQNDFPIESYRPIHNRSNALIGNTMIKLEQVEEEAIQNDKNQQSKQSESSSSKSSNQPSIKNQQSKFFFKSSKLQKLEKKFTKKNIIDNSGSTSVEASNSVSVSAAGSKPSKGIPFFYFCDPSLNTPLMVNELSGLYKSIDITYALQKLSNIQRIEGKYHASLNLTAQSEWRGRYKDKCISTFASPICLFSQVAMTNLDRWVTSSLNCGYTYSAFKKEGKHKSQRKRYVLENGIRIYNKHKGMLGYRIDSSLRTPQEASTAVSEKAFKRLSKNLSKDNEAYRETVKFTISQRDSQRPLYELRNSHGLTIQPMIQNYSKISNSTFKKYLKAIENKFKEFAQNSRNNLDKNREKLFVSLHNSVADKYDEKPEELLKDLDESFKELTKDRHRKRLDLDNLIKRLEKIFDEAVTEILRMPIMLAITFFYCSRLEPDRFISEQLFKQIKHAFPKEVAKILEVFNNLFPEIYMPIDKVTKLKGNLTEIFPMKSVDEAANTSNNTSSNDASSFTQNANRKGKNISTDKCTSTQQYRLKLYEFVKQQVFKLVLVLLSPGVMINLHVLLEKLSLVRCRQMSVYEFGSQVEKMDYDPQSVYLSSVYVSESLRSMARPKLDFEKGNSSKNGKTEKQYKTENEKSSLPSSLQTPPLASPSSSLSSKKPKNESESSENDKEYDIVVDFIHWKKYSFKIGYIAIRFGYDIMGSLVGVFRSEPSEVNEIDKKRSMLKKHGYNLKSFFSGKNNSEEEDKNNNTITENENGKNDGAENENNDNQKDQSKSFSFSSRDSSSLLPSYNSKEQQDLQSPNSTVDNSSSTQVNSNNSSNPAIENSITTLSEPNHAANTTQLSSNKKNTQTLLFEAVSSNNPFADYYEALSKPQQQENENSTGKIGESSDNVTEKGEEEQNEKKAVLSLSSSSASLASSETSSKISLFSYQSGELSDKEKKSGGATYYKSEQKRWELVRRYTKEYDILDSKSTFIGTRDIHFKRALNLYKEFYYDLAKIVVTMGI